MGKLLILLTFLSSSPKTDERYRLASETSRQALLQYAFVRNELNELESDAHREIFRLTGLTKTQLTYLGYGYPIFLGKISTKPFTNFKIEYRGFTIRPILEYNFKSSEDPFTGALSITKEF